MRAATGSLDDLETDIENLYQLLDILVDTTGDQTFTRPDGGRCATADRLSALAEIARDMGACLIEDMAACHAKVIADRRAGTVKNWPDGELHKLIEAYVEAQRVNHEAIRAVENAKDENAKQAEDLAQDEAAQGEDDALTAICAYRPASDHERSWRGDFLKNVFRQEGGQEPTDEQMEAMIDAATPQAA